MCISQGKPFKGRKCAEKVNLDFRYMQADMHNLVPAIGEVNGLRSNYPYRMIEGEKRRFGACDMEISNRMAEPPEYVRGDIARTYFYMDTAYPNRGIVNDDNREMLEEWSALDPVDEWECEREERIRELQGNENEFVSRECVVTISRKNTNNLSELVTTLSGLSFSACHCSNNGCSAGCLSCNSPNSSFCASQSMWAFLN